MIKSQVNQIAESKNAYLIVLNKRKRGDTTRYAVYLDHNKKDLSVLWPYNQCEIEDKKSFRLLPYQVYSKSEHWNYPAFHFAVSGIQVSHFNEMKRMLQRINPDINVYGLNGWSPSCN